MDFRISRIALSFCILFVNASRLLSENLDDRTLILQNPALFAVYDTSAQVTWQLLCNGTGDLSRFKYRPKNCRATQFWNGTRGKLIWNETTGNFLAEREIRKEVYERWKNVVTSSTKEIVISLSGLRPNVVYEFEAKRIAQNCVQVGEIEFRTAGYSQYRYPRLGSGAFQIYYVNTTHREVRIYWPPEDGPYFLSIYEAGEKTPPSDLYALTGPMESGSLSRIISMQNHSFEFGSSRLFVPSSHSIFADFEDNLVYVREQNITTLTWLKPNELNVQDNYNYTVFWIDSYDYGFPTSIVDFVSLPKNQTTFKVEADGPVVLGVSVNSESTSSGIIIATRSKKVN